MKTSKTVREKVVMNKTSLETLVNINEVANQAGYVVVVGTMNKGDNVSGWNIATNSAVYIILSEHIIRDPEKLFAEEYVAVSREEVMEKLVRLISGEKA